MKNWIILLLILTASAVLTAFIPDTVPGNHKSALSAQRAPVTISAAFSRHIQTTMLSPADSSASFEHGKLLYKTYCLSCHQFDGGGVENLNPPIIKTPYVLGSKTRLIKIILHGFKEKVEIEGDTYSNNMPPLNNLTDQQIADVLTYVRNDFGNKAVRVKRADVQQVRAGSVTK